MCIRDSTYHFAYADGGPFHLLGTTSYGWTHQVDAQEELTLRTLAASPFNKVRMCVFPTSESWNRGDQPNSYPFAGGPTNFDFTRFNPLFFQHLEKRVGNLRNLGIEADVILFHPCLLYTSLTVGHETHAINSVTIIKSVHFDGVRRVVREACGQLHVQKRIPIRRPVQRDLKNIPLFDAGLNIAGRVDYKK